MKKIKKVVFKSFYRNVLPTTIIFGIIIIFLAIIIDYDNIGGEENIPVFVAMGFFAVILIVYLLIMCVNKSKKFTKIKKYIEDNSLSYDDEFEKLTKYIYVSKDILVDTSFNSKCVVHIKMIESYKKSIVKAGKQFIKAITFTLKDGLKEEVCMCINKEDYEKVADYLESKNIACPLIEEITDREEIVETNRIHQPKAAFMSIIAIILLSVAFGAGYYFLNTNEENAQHVNADDEMLKPVTLSEDYIEVSSDYYAGGEIVHIFNTSEHLLAVDMVITNGDKVEDIGEVYIRPYGIYFYPIEKAFDVQEYSINDYGFYRSTNKSIIEYKAYISENFENYLDIALYNDDMNEINVKAILIEEKDYIPYADYQKQSYYFFDMNPEILETEYPEEGSHSYMGIIDNTSKSVEIYKNIDGVDTIIETFKY